MEGRRLQRRLSVGQSRLAFGDGEGPTQAQLVICKKLLLFMFYFSRCT